MIVSCSFFLSFSYFAFLPPYTNYTRTNQSVLFCPVRSLRRIVPLYVQTIRSELPSGEACLTPIHTPFDSYRVNPNALPIAQLSFLFFFSFFHRPSDLDIYRQSIRPCIPQLQHSRLDTFSLWRLVSGIFFQALPTSHPGTVRGRWA